ncbi:MAG: TrmH family RNA methyltransferase [Gammaproteobacteria bacterium]
MQYEHLTPAQCADVIDYLSEYINPDRRALLETVLAQRTRYFTVVLEDIYQSQNANAVVRTMECLGIQDLYVIEQNNEYQLNPGVLQGADKWLQIYRHNQAGGNNTEACLQSLKDKGYRIAAMTLDDQSVPLEQLAIDKPTAFCFGTEEQGLTDTAQGLADVSAKIPLYGFTRSYNVSVSAAISLYTLIARLKASDADWQLSATEKDRLLIDWLAQSTPAGQQLLKQFLTGLGEK